MKNNKPTEEMHSRSQTVQANNDAHAAAEKDIAKDPDLTISQKNNDLDEGELARLGGDRNKIA